MWLSVVEGRVTLLSTPFKGVLTGPEGSFRIDAGTDGDCVVTPVEGGWTVMGETLDAEGQPQPAVGVFVDCDEAEHSYHAFSDLDGVFLVDIPVDADGLSCEAWVRRGMRIEPASGPRVALELEAGVQPEWVRLPSPPLQSPLSSDPELRCFEAAAFRGLFGDAGQPDTDEPDPVVGPNYIDVEVRRMVEALPECGGTADLSDEAERQGWLDYFNAKGPLPVELLRLVEER